MPLIGYIHNIYDIKVMTQPARSVFFPVIIKIFLLQVNLPSFFQFIGQGISSMLKAVQTWQEFQLIALKLEF